MLCSALGIGVVPYVKYMRGRVDSFPTLEGIVTEQVGLYVRALNQSLVQRGLFWNVVPGYFWLELHIDKLIIHENSGRELLGRFNSKLDKR